MAALLCAALGVPVAPAILLSLALGAVHLGAVALLTMFLSASPLRRLLVGLLFAPIAIAVNVVRELCGPNWHPLGVEVACRAPRSHRAFEPEVRRLQRPEDAQNAQVTGT